MTQRLLQGISILILLTACKTKVPKSDPIFDDKKKLTERLALVESAGLMESLGIPNEIANQVNDFYKERNFKPVWSNDSMMVSKGLKMENFFRNPTSLALPEKRLLKANDDSITGELIARELLLTARFTQLINDLKTGFFDTTKMDYRPILPGALDELKKRVDQFDTVTKWGTWFASFGPAHKDYQRLARSLFHFARTKHLSKIHYEIPALDDDSVACMRLSTEALIDKGYLDSTKTDSSSFWQAMAAFQADNGLKADGVLGTYTRKNLGESTFYKCQRAILSLERWRWRTPFPERYLWVNIPEYTLRIYYNDTLFLTHRVVVGKPENQTPQLQSRLRTIVALPYWTQPHSIASKEFLPAIQHNSNYAAKNHYKVFRGETEVDPTTINWKKYKEKNFPFRVRQEPGNDNALGLVKFEFSNKFGVYLHDTPSKSFFNKDVRAYSHGCVRVQMPDSLARFILSRDDDKRQKMTRDSLDSIVSRKEHFPIALYKPIPIQLDYITVMADTTGKIIFYTDIYDRDKAYLEKLKIYQKEN